MKMKLSLLILLLHVLTKLEVTEGLRVVAGRKVHVFQGRGLDVLSDLKCEPHKAYIVPDPYHCDRFLVCGSNGRREIRLCKDPEETFHQEQGFCWKRDEDHCLKTGRTRRWNIDTFGMEIRLFQDLKAKRVSRSISSSQSLTDQLKGVECELDPLAEGYIVPDPHYCNRYLECDHLANGEIKLCPEAESFNMDTGLCQDKISVDCSDRTKRWKVAATTKPSFRPRVRLFGGLRSPAPFFTTASTTRTPLTTTTITTTTTTTAATTTAAPFSESVVHNDPLEEAECAGGEEYVVPDPLHCDRYLLCPDHFIQLCEPGQVLDTETGYCAPQAGVNCGLRTLNMRNIRAQLDLRLQEKVKNIDRETKEINLFLSTSTTPTTTTTTTTTKNPKISKQNSIRRFGTQLKEISSTTPAPEPIKSQVTEPNSLLNIFASNNLRASVVDKETASNKQVERITSPSRTLALVRPSISPSRIVANTPGIKVVKNTLDIRTANVVSPVSKPLESVEDVQCQRTGVGYKVADKTQCDRFVDCNPDGVKTISLCPDGLAFSVSKSHCDYISKVDCSSRPNLQEPRSTKLCPRENGYFPVAPEISCSQYVDCRNGVGYLTNCGAGAVFDEAVGCVHPDQTSRAGCSASEKYDFICPTFGLYQRFGDHDRLPHPSDCSLFYACLRNGEPRLLSCQAPKVFNPESGFCEHQDEVPGCQGFYPETLLQDKKELAEKIREELLKEYGLSR